MIDDIQTFESNDSKILLPDSSNYCRKYSFMLHYVKHRSLVNTITYETPEEKSSGSTRVILLAKLLGHISQSLNYEIYHPKENT